MAKRAKSNTAKSKRHGPRYRKVEVAVWGDDKFRSLSAPAPNGQSIWLYLLCGPRTTTFPGLVVAREAVMASDLGWSVEGFREAFAELVAAELVDADEKSGVVLLRKALFHGTGFTRDDVRETARPESPNVIIGWSKSWPEIPDGSLKERYLQLLGAFAEALGEGFVKAYREGFRKALAKASGEACHEAYPQPSPDPSSNQEQEQEQDQEQKGSTALSLTRARAIPPGGTWQRHHTWWSEMREAHRRLRTSGILPNAPDLPPQPGKLNADNIAACERMLAEQGFDAAAIDARVRHAIAVVERECLRDQTLKYIQPALMWEPERFNRSVDTTLEDAARPKASRDRAGPRPAGSAIGPATPRNDHGVSEGLEPFAKGLVP